MRRCPRPPARQRAARSAEIRCIRASQPIAVAIAPRLTTTATASANASSTPVAIHTAISARCGRSSISAVTGTPSTIAVIPTYIVVRLNIRIAETAAFGGTWAASIVTFTGSPRELPGVRRLIAIPLACAANTWR